MPWRCTELNERGNAYAIFVSEVMLQQTQVERVRVKFAEFMRVFPAPQVLAKATVGEMIAVWKGLGYNRRALNLKRAMEIVVESYGGTIPLDIKKLDALPGIGPATAAAIYTYTLNKPSVFIETNIRSVFIDAFFKDKANVADSELLPLIEATVDQENPREWYYALMDYGTMLKRTRTNPSRASKHHAKQSKFEGSHRQVRGKLLEIFLAKKSLNEVAIKRAHQNLDPQKISKALNELVKEGFLKKVRGGFTLP